MTIGSAGKAFRVLLTPIALLLLFACADTAQIPPAQSHGSTSRLFGRAYDEITTFYIAPRAPKDVALPALRRLTTLDPALAVVEEGDDLVLRDKDAVVTRLPQPAPRDAAGWGEITMALLTAATEDSTAVARLSDDEREKALFAGITATLDRFSRYSSPDAAREERAAREGFEGIGVTIDYANEDVIVTSVVAGGPAERAGLRVDDRILAIDGAATGAMPHDEVVRRLRGPSDSQVEVILRRAGEAVPLRRMVGRAYIVVPTITAHRDGATAVLRISSFNEHTNEMLRDEFEKLRRDGHGPLRGVVLDLRGNPGGLLDQAVSVAGAFLPSGRVVSTTGRNPSSNQEFEARRGDIAAGLPMAVVVNGGSASSAEIVAAALQDAGRAVVVGTSSYGKGTVQMVLRLPNDGELILTWARLVTPAGYVLHEHGLVPSVCTSGEGEGEAALGALLRRSAQHNALAEKPRASLNEAEWSELRRRCPTQTKDRDIDIRAAERVLASPTLYAHLARVELPAVIARGTVPHGGLQ